MFRRIRDTVMKSERIENQPNWLLTTTTVAIGTVVTGSGLQGTFAAPVAFFLLLVWSVAFAAKMTERIVTAELEMRRLKIKESDNN